MIGVHNIPKLRDDQASTRKLLVLLSGGLDSTTLAFWLANQGYTIDCLYLDYGQGETNPERECAICIAQLLGAKIDILETPRPRDSLTKCLPLLNSEVAMLTDAVSLCTMAVAFASASRADAVHLGVNANDRQVHPLLQARFFRAIENTAGLSLGRNLRLMTPFLDKDKASIMRIGLKLSVPYQNTWSCSVSVEKHCGRCADCVARKLAFREVGLADPTRYELAEC